MSHPEPEPDGQDVEPWAELYESYTEAQHGTLAEQDAEAVELEAALAEELRRAGVPWVEGGH